MTGLLHDIHVIEATERFPAHRPKIVHYVDETDQIVDSVYQHEDAAEAQQRVLAELERRYGRAMPWRS